MKLNKNMITALIAAGAISSVANAGSGVSLESLNLDAKVNLKIESILSDYQSSDAQKLDGIQMVLQKAKLAKEFKAMQVQDIGQANGKAVGGMTCGSYNL